MTTTRIEMSPGLMRPKPLDRKVPEGMRTFTLYRGQGKDEPRAVLQGVIFSTGQTVVQWLTPSPRGSLNIFENFQQFRHIHIRTHDGAVAVITFGDGEQMKF